MSPEAPSDHAGLIWVIADLVLGDYEQTKYGRVTPPDGGAFYVRHGRRPGRLSVKRMSTAR